MESTIFIRSQKGNLYIYDFLKKEIFLCHPLIYELYKNERKDFHRISNVNIKYSKEEISYYVNMNYVGKLIISSNGHYYVTMQKPSIGSITEDISSIIEREWTNGYLWKYRRDQEPCSKCIYHALCPSPSDYEFAIGKMNLCSII